MYEFLRGNRDFVSKLSAVLKGTAVAALVAGLSLPAFGQITGTTSTTTGPSALFCTVPTVLPPGTTTATSTSSTTAMPVVTGSLIPGSAGTTLSCGAFGGTQNLQNLAFTAEGIVPADFVLSNVALTLPSDVFTSLITGTSELRDVVSLSGNTMVIDLFTVPSTTTFPTSASSMAGGALSVTPAGSLLSEMRMQVANVVVTDSSANPTMLFSGVVTSNTTGTTTPTGTTGAISTTTGATSTTAGTTATGTVGITNPLGTTATSATTPTGMATGVGSVPNLFGNIVGRAASVSLAFNSPIVFPGLGSTAVVTGATAFGPRTVTASMMQVSVAGAFVFASPTTSVTFDVPVTPGAFQTTTTTGATTTGATTTTGGVTTATPTGGITGGITGGGI